MRPLFQPWLLALSAASLSVGSSFLFGHQLRRNERIRSHQIVTEDELFSAPTKTSPAMAAEGRKLFLNSCAHCHGADATGDEGPDLHDLQVSDRYIRNLITRGIPHEMPSFAKKLDAEKIALITAYLRTLGDMFRR